MTPEGLIKREIMDWLEANPSCYPRMIQVSGIKGRASPTKGVADIICMWKGRGIAIEVKTCKGVLSKEQTEFMLSWKSAGGIAIVARSLDDVKRELVGELK